MRHCNCERGLVLACLLVVAAGSATPGATEEKKAEDGLVQLFNGNSDGLENPSR